MSSRVAQNFRLNTPSAQSHSNQSNTTQPQETQPPILLNPYWTRPYAVQSLLTQPNAIKIHSYSPPVYLNFYSNWTMKLNLLNSTPCNLTLSVAKLTQLNTIRLNLYSAKSLCNSTPFKTKLIQLNPLNSTTFSWTSTINFC